MEYNEKNGRRAIYTWKFLIVRISTAHIRAYILSQSSQMIDVRTFDFDQFHIHLYLPKVVHFICMNAST